MTSRNCSRGGITTIGSGLVSRQGTRNPAGCSASEAAGHYMPNQSLFDKEQVMNMLDSDEAKDRFDPDHIDSHGEVQEVQEPRDQTSPYDDTEGHLLNFYGAQHTPEAQYNMPMIPTPPASTRNLTSTPRPHSRSHSRLPLDMDVANLLQQQAVLDQQKVMQEEQRKLFDKQLEFEKKIKAIEESQRISVVLWECN